MMGARNAGRKRKAGLVLALAVVAILLWAWWDGGEEPLSLIEQPVQLAPGTTGTMAEGQE